MAYLKPKNDGEKFINLFMAARFNFQRDLESLQKVQHVTDESTGKQVIKYIDFTDQEKYILFALLSHLGCATKESIYGKQTSAEMINLFSLELLNDQALYLISSFVESITENREYKERASMHYEEAYLYKYSKEIQSEIKNILTFREQALRSRKA